MAFNVFPKRRGRVIHTNRSFIPIKEFIFSIKLVLSTKNLSLDASSNSLFLKSLFKKYAIIKTSCIVDSL